jgi:hypothetical protein
MTKLFHKLQDIYYDALRLREDLERLPTECGCCDAQAHLAGKCCCERLPSADATPSHCADYRPALDRLLEDVRLFEADLKREGRGFMSGELGWDLNRAGATVGGIGRLAEQIGRELADRGGVCAPKALLILKEETKSLGQRIDELNNSLSDPASTTGKWLPLRRAKEGAARTARGGAPEIAREVRGEGPVTPERLRELAARHRACFEVWPEWATVWGAKTQIGYRLELCGVNAHEEAGGDDHPVPGCWRCRRTYDDLRKIAEWVMPREERPSRYEVEPFDRAWHVAPKQRRSRNEIVLAVKILHRRDVNRPVDECEQRCLKEMRARIAGLGIEEGVYREERVWAGTAPEGAPA